MQRGARCLYACVGGRRVGIVLEVAEGNTQHSCPMKAVQLTCLLQRYAHFNGGAVCEIQNGG